MRMDFFSLLDFFSTVCYGTFYDECKIILEFYKFGESLYTRKGKPGIWLYGGEKGRGNTQSTWPSASRRATMKSSRKGKPGNHIQYLVLFSSKIKREMT